MDAQQLDRLKSWATIVGAIGTPITIAIFGALVQNSIADRGISRDYTEMALQILREADPAKQRELRAWAIEVMDKNNPVRISGDSRAQLIAGLGASAGIPLDIVPEEYMTEPRTWEKLPDRPVSQKEVSDMLNENHRRFDLNAADHRALVETVRILQDGQMKLTKELLKQKEERERR